VLVSLQWAGVMFISSYLQHTQLCFHRRIVVIHQTRWRQVSRVSRTHAFVTLLIQANPVRKALTPPFLDLPPTLSPSPLASHRQQLIAKLAPSIPLPVLTMRLPLYHPAVILLAFVLALGFLLVILSSALWANWLPLLVGELLPLPSSSSPSRLHCPHCFFFRNTFPFLVPFRIPLSL